MDASNQPEKANKTADAAQGRDNTADPAANTPRIESPSLVPEQGEPVVAEHVGAADDASPKLGGTALIVASVTDEPRREQAEPASSTRARYETLKNWRLNKFSSLAASLALAVGVGVIAGAIGTLGLQRTLTQEASANPKVLQDSIVRLTSEFAAFKSSVEASSKTATGQFTRLTERLDRAERAQIEPASRLARISDAVERLERRTAGATVPAMSPVAAPRGPADVTGSIAAAPAAGSKDLSRLPVIPGWVLHSVQGGAAIVQSRMGLMELEVGDPLPGGGRVEAIRRDGGRWVVVTSRGLIVAR
jgi:hypothetical protein